MQHRQNVAQKPNGDIVAGASVTVTTYPGGVAAVLYSDNGITPIPGGNVVSTDLYGNYSYYVANGRYTETIVGTGLTTQTLQDIVLADPAVPTITGGSIDGTTIGQNDPRAVNATTVTASSVASTGASTAASYTASAGVSGATVTGTSVLRGTSQLPYVLAQTAIPVILVPNGTVATNGTITLGTALPTTYANAWIRLPAGAVSGGSAGVYYCVFSSTTVGQVYTNFADPSTTAFTPSIPTSPVAATGSNAAYTQTTGASVALVNTTVLAGAMGANGKLRTFVCRTFINNANTKSGTSFFGGSLVSSWGVTAQSINTEFRQLQNRGVQNSQMNSWGDGVSGVGSGTFTAALTYTAIDTANNQAYTQNSQIATATDYIVLEGFTIEVLHKP